METNEKHHQRIAALTFASVYPHYLTKVTKKGRTEEELQEVIHWLTGFTKADLQRLLDANVTFQTFFDEAELHPNAAQITGTICGHRIENIHNPLTKKVRYLDKLVDELAKGRPLSKIFRNSQ